MLNFLQKTSAKNFFRFAKPVLQRGPLCIFAFLTPFAILHAVKGGDKTLKSTDDQYFFKIPGSSEIGQNAAINISLNQSWKVFARKGIRLTQGYTPHRIRLDLQYYF